MFLYTNAELSEKDIQKTISFIEHQKEYNAGIHLAKEVKYLYNENYERYERYSVFIGLEELTLLKHPHYPKQCTVQCNHYQNSYRNRTTNLKFI